MATWFSATRWRRSWQALGETERAFVLHSGRAFLGGLLFVASTLAVTCSLALAGWYLADAGAHGDTIDALAVGAVAWLAGVGAAPQAGDLPIAVTPLAITVLHIVGAFRAGRWAALRSRTEQDRWTLVRGTLAFASAAVLATIALTTLIAAGDQVTLTGGSTPYVLVLLVAVLAGGAGLGAGGGVAREIWEAQAGWIRSVLAGAVAIVAAMVLAGAALAAAALATSFGEAVNVLAALRLSPSELLSYGVVLLLFLPNTALFGVAYLLGPGFSVGVGTTVATSGVSLGATPAVPLFAALPEQGTPSGWWGLAIVVPVVAAMLATAVVFRPAEPTSWDLSLVRGAGAGFLAGVLLTVMVGQAGGDLGTGRLRELGAPGAEILVFATGLLTLGGALGALVVGWSQRRAERREEVASGPVAAGSAPEAR